MQRTEVSQFGQSIGSTDKHEKMKVNREKVSSSINQILLAGRSGQGLGSCMINNVPGCLDAILQVAGRIILHIIVSWGSSSGGHPKGF